MYRTAGLESDTRQRKRACARSLSLSDQWARERLALEVARKLVEPAPGQVSLRSQDCIEGAGVTLTRLPPAGTMF